jgi:hypothetical protein
MIDHGIMQKLLFTFAALLASAASAGCSSDSKGAGTGGTGAASGTGGTTATGGAAATGGGTATGGSSSSGGSTASGGAATGGGTSYDPALVAKCGIGDTACLSCLAVSCCDVAKLCLDEAACAHSFDAYQACVKSTPDDVSKCFSVFANAVRREDGGVKTHEPLLQCIFNFADPSSSCAPCGVPAAF